MKHEPLTLYPLKSCPISRTEKDKFDVTSAVSLPGDWQIKLLSFLKSGCHTFGFFAR